MDSDQLPTNSSATADNLNKYFKVDKKIWKNFFEYKVKIKFTDNFFSAQIASVNVIKQLCSFSATSVYIT
jgi:hypothetical protein